MKLLAIFVLALLLLLIWRPGFNFWSQKAGDYAGTEPAFDIRGHLSGDLISEGVIYGPTGKVVSRFVADMRGVWDGDTGTLSEAFTYASGETQDREWQLRLTEDGGVVATAADIIGEGTGSAEGAAMNLNYKIRLPEDAGGHVLTVHDWMYLMPNGTIINRSEMRKFGLKVAELVATIRPAK